MSSKSPHTNSFGHILKVNSETNSYSIPLNLKFVYCTIKHFILMQKLVELGSDGLFERKEGKQDWPS
jgi:hypothetical protein